MIKIIIPTNQKPKFSFFESVNIKTRWEPIKGLVVGFEWFLNGDCTNPLDLSNGVIQYSIYQNEEKFNCILEEPEKNLVKADHKFPEIIYPSNKPKYKIGQRIKDPEGDFIVCSCQWGAVDDKNFIPGWEYLVYWTTNECDDNSRIFWDVDAAYSEKELTERINCQIKQNQSILMN